MSKKITLNSLATSIDDLAAMVKHGFDDVYEKMDKNFREVRAELKSIQRRFDNLEEKHRDQIKESKACRDHRTLTDTRLNHLESAIS